MITAAAFIGAAPGNRRQADQAAGGPLASLAGLDQSIVREFHDAAARVHGTYEIASDDLKNLKDYLKSLDLENRNNGQPELAVGTPARVRFTRQAILDWLAEKQTTYPPAAHVVDRLYQLTDGLGPLDALFADQTVTGMHVYDWNKVRYNTTKRANIPARPFLNSQVYSTVQRNLQDLGDVNLTQSDPSQTWTIPGGHRITMDSEWLAADAKWSLVIRKHRSEPLTRRQLIEMGSISAVADLFLLRALMRRASIIFDGPPGAGKTTLMQAYVNRVSLTRRAVIIEREAEMNPPERGLVTHLEAQKRNAPGSKVFDMGELVAHAVWHDPEIIVLGEVTDKAAADVIEGMTIGRSAMTTTHGSGPNDVLQRWENWIREATDGRDPMAIKSQLAHSIDFIVTVLAGRSILREGGPELPPSMVVGIHEVRGLNPDGSYNIVPVFTLDEHHRLVAHPAYLLLPDQIAQGLWEPSRIARLLEAHKTQRRPVAA